MTTPAECPNCLFNFETGEVPPVPTWYEIISERAEALGLPFPSYEHCMRWADERRVPESLLEETAESVANLPDHTWTGKKPRYKTVWLTVTNWCNRAKSQPSYNRY